MRETPCPFPACHRTEVALSVARLNYKQRGVMAKCKKKESASQAETPPDSNFPAMPVGEPAPTVSIDAPPLKDVSHGDQAEQQGQPSAAGRSSFSENEPDRRPSYPDPNVPFPIAHDNEAGLKLLKSERYKQMQLAFSMPAADDVDRRLVDLGWKYRPEEKVYTKQYGENGAGTAMVEAKRLYEELVEELLDEKGISRRHAR